MTPFAVVMFFSAVLLAIGIIPKIIEWWREP